MEDLASMFHNELGKDERLLWYGRPRQGLVLRRSDAFMVPFSLVISLVFSGWVIGNFTRHLSYYLFVTPVLLWALYMVFGRFFVDAFLRTRTFYALTNERVLILSQVFNRDLRSLQLKTLTDINLKLNKGGSGTIIFGPSTPRGAMYDGTPLPGSRRYLPPTFELIEDARKVYDLVRRAQKELG